MEISKLSGIVIPQPNSIWLPPLLEQRTLWGDIEYLPIKMPQDNRMQRQVFNPQKNLANLSLLERNKKHYLGCHLIPRNVMVEGREEFPMLKPYTGSLPDDTIGIDERVPHKPERFAVHGFCYDNVLMQKVNNFDRAVQKSRHYHCAIGWNFTTFLDGRRCEVVEAIRLNRYTTLGLQLRGIPTIQSHAICSCRFFDFVHDGLAPNCPVAIGNRLKITDPALQTLQRVAIEELIRRKRPTVLVVVGYPLNFDPGIPVVCYKSRIEKIRNHEYGQRKIS